MSTRGQFGDSALDPRGSLDEIVRAPTGAAGTSLACWLIGGESLLQECGDILLRGGHEVRGVVSSSSRIAAWARARDLPLLDPADDLESVLARQPFDHLFAITHLALLPDRLLALPAHGAINFHDGPLPEYAGLNAPSWALVNGEARHGVTWHVMTSELDGGPVLKQRGFEIAREETSASLNAKCFAAALESFEELVLELSRGTSRTTPQDSARRRVHARHRRPPAACTLDWTRSARELEALVRALDFERHPNPLGLAKVGRSGRSLLVTEARAHDGSEQGGTGHGAANGSAAVAPGTVLALGADEIRVMTGSGSLALQGFAELDGLPLDATRAAHRLGLAPGIALDRLAPEEVLRLTELDRRMSRAERAWVRRLSALDPIQLPLPTRAPSSDTGMHALPAVLEPSVPPELATSFPEHPPALVVAAAFCAFLARLSRRASFDLGYADSASHPLAGEGWIAARLPLRIEVDLSQGLRPLLERVAAERTEVSALGPWLLDLVARHPELRALRGRAETLLPVALELVSGGARAERTCTRGQWLLEVREELAPDAGACRFVYDPELVSPEHAASFQAGFSALLASLAAHPDLPLGAHTVVSREEQELQSVTWNRTELLHRRDVCVHTLFEEQAARTPAATALVCGADALTYAELDARADRLAEVLVARGVCAGRLVAIFLERSVDLVVAVLGILKAGGAYVPLDPEHPRERLAFVLEDAEVAAIVTDTRLEDALPVSATERVRLDVDLARTDVRAPMNPRPERVGARSTDLAYVIYTSGSSGRPKGVLVEHRNVASFFAAMDERIPHAPPGVWLALTGLAFDISVLELLWPLCRGFKVVVHAGDERARNGAAPAPQPGLRPVDFSLFYFANDEGERSEGYRLLLEGARFADAHGFSAVWTPERHFHAFGGLYPNPAVTGAAIATLTRHVQIRAGSVVLPLHHPIRVAEDWALVDNLSGGRVALSFASGWNPEDFVLAPRNHSSAKTVMFRDIEVVRRLWRGESLPFPGPGGEPVQVRTLPRPVQPELPVWLTAAGNPDTFEAAGRIGASVLTHLLGQSLEQLAPKIAVYRAARARAGFDPATGKVALMLHTFVGEDEEQVRARVRAPLERYLASSLDLLKQHAWTFPAFQRASGTSSADEEALAALGPEERAALLAHAVERYCESSGLFGTPERCLAQVARVRAIDVDEIACLIDFGVPTAEVLASLPLLDRVRSRARALRAPEAAPATLGALILGERVTHLQCTPSLARILCSDPEIRPSLHHLRHVFVGGEALGAELAGELVLVIGGSLTNMYGPTETTIWSSTHLLAADSGGVAHGETAGTIPIGRPIANTRFHVLDEQLQPLPLGVAGELFIAGDGVARGYLRRPELDAERFLGEPLRAGGTGEGSRMYRSGDLVRYRADGELEFLGRIDHQIKLRGQRVEPGEIEAELMREDVSGRSLAEVVVVAREDTPGDQRLVAYLVPRGSAPDPTMLRTRLEARLPAHMVPTQFVSLERLPLNPNGKIDRRALPAPAEVPRADCVLPVGALEARLAELWREILGLTRVGVEDNFFDLGGHSLLVVRLHRRMHELAPKPVPLTDLFRFPTIRSLARHIASETGAEAHEEASLRGRRRRKAIPTRRQRVREG